MDFQKVVNNFCASGVTVAQPSIQADSSGAKPTLALQKSPYISAIKLSAANCLLEKFHYLGPVRTASACFGHAEGATVWGVLRSRTWDKRLRASGFFPIELIRMVGLPDHRWATSSLLSHSVRQLGKESGFDCFVTYADPMAGHTGNVYRAANWKRLEEDAQPDGFVWKLDGKTVSRKRFFAELGTSKIETVKAKYKDRLVLIPDVPKRRFVFLQDWERFEDFLVASKKKKTWGKARTKNFYSAPK